MKRSYLGLAATVAVLASACAQRVVRESGGDVAMGSAATMEGRGGDFRGREGWNRTRGSVFARPIESGTQVALTVTSGTPGSRYGWDVREGKCDTDGRLLGDSTSYQPIWLGDQGMGSSVAELPLRLDAQKEYFVNLYSSATDRTTIIGCGSIRK